MGEKDRGEGANANETGVYTNSFALFVDKRDSRNCFFFFSLLTW